MEAMLLKLIFALSLGLQHAHSQDTMNLIRLPQASETMGAVCLDGSPPGYYIRRGNGDGANKWILHIEGGGWCFTTEDCFNRTFTRLGSTDSEYWPEVETYPGMLSNSEDENPDFYNWNHVAFIYCDGGSFAGDREEPDVHQNATIYYRGYRNLKAIIRDLNEERGLQSATDVILTGCSAGGLAVFLHADFLGTLIVNTANYRAFPDAGYFFDLPNGMALYNGFTLLMALQNVDEALIPACAANFNGSNLVMCLFPQVTYTYTSTPMFVLNSQYDSALVEGLTMITCIPPDCEEDEAATIQSFYDAFDSAIQPVLSSAPSNGYFLDSCYTHCQLFEDERAWSQYAIEGRTIAQTFGDWYFERPGDTRLKDCDSFPCNPTCSDVPGGAVRILANPLAFLALLMTSYLAWI